MSEDWRQKDNVLQQDNLIYLGLIGIGIVLVQPFLTEASLDVSAMVCVVAFSLSIPLLAFLVMVNKVQVLHRHMSNSNFSSVAKGVAILSACTGIVAAFWHMTWIAGVVVSAAGVLGLGIYTGYYMRLERDTRTKPTE
ncbi:hypothetical protein [Nonomuraea sp. NPDC049709]|uniref:hypothetical protein n=1 Tax=Nonomuraea sp. NPDC049709 TaxID=3154736 RepID=UPI00343D0971